MLGISKAPSTNSINNVAEPAKGNLDGGPAPTQAVPLRWQHESAPCHWIPGGGRGTDPAETKEDHGTQFGYISVLKYTYIWY